MDYQRVSATFQNADDAENAYRWLRDNGISDDDIAIMASDEQVQASVGAERKDRAEEAKDVGKDAGKGAMTGAGVGALFGLAALAIPGIGPFITAGWLATALGTTAGAIASGAIVGGTAGTLAGALTNIGYGKEESERYAQDVKSGMTFISVNVPAGSSTDVDEIHDTFRQHNGRTMDER